MWLLSPHCNAASGCPAIRYGETKERWWCREGEGGYTTWREVGIRGDSWVCMLLACVWCVACLYSGLGVPPLSLQGHSWAAAAASCGGVDNPAWNSQHQVEGEEQEHEVRPPGCHILCLPVCSPVCLSVCIFCLSIYSVCLLVCSHKCFM